MEVVLDPRWPRERLARVGRDVSFTWLTLNRLPLPDRVYFDRESANAARREFDVRSKYMLRPEWLGVYQRRWEGGWSAIAIDVAGVPMQRRVKTPNGSFWQAPGFAEDFTPYGTFCHEVGHHADYTLHPKAYSAQNGFEDVVLHEEDVSRIEHSVTEAFAEAIRLFIANPNLLREGRPERFEYLTKMGLKQLHDTPWRVVLSKAGKRVLSAAEKWIAST